MDIPIRPRYGIAEPNQECSSPEQKETPHRTPLKNSSEVEMASSYSEIPFLAGSIARKSGNDTTHIEGSQSSNRFDNKVKNDSSYNIEGNEEYSDNDEDNSDAETKKQHNRPKSLQYDSSFPYKREQTMTGADGEMLNHFVAENFKEEVQSTSPHKRKDHMAFASHSRTPSTSTGTGSMLTRHFLQTQQPQIDANVLGDIELEAQYLAASVDNLLENLCNLLHSISSITADNVEVHRNAVNKLTDSMDANIKCMYTIMAKTEEITKSMRPTEQLGQRIREIKRLVDMLETTM